VVVAYHTFEGAARQGAKLLGVPGLRLAVAEYPKPTDAEEVNRKKLQSLFQQAVESLVAPTRKVPAAS